MNSLDSFHLYYEELPKKSLTNLKRTAKIKKSKRKDQMKKDTNIITIVAGVLLVGSSAIGFTEYLGGSLKDALAGSLITACLVALATLKDNNGRK